MNNSLIVPKMNINAALRENAIFVDVRSPKEFEEFHIPGAINIPLFDNEERAQVGTLYKQEGEEQAKDLGIQILSAKLPDFYAAFKKLHQDNEGKSLIVYCWRGGMRSLSLTSVMSLLGLPVAQLNGGVRSFRQAVTSTLDMHASSPRKFIVIEGLTGTGKTDILHELSHEGYPVIDIEGLANHRGSVFGGIGSSPISQKAFETRLWARLEELDDSPYFIIEAESKRIGNVILPDFILQGKENGHRMQIEADLDFRVNTICMTYPFEAFHDEFRQSLSRLEKRIPPKVYADILAAFDRKDYPNFVSSLLLEYYDPRYKHAFKQYDTSSYHISISRLDEGVQLVKQNVTHILDKWDITH
ncbi:tRNA 2-selenouridine(34) synthase MnmH [Caldalkalibacillus salinus]|uniref:tRNA 2-selenouridine(34) synthase MnmH n=1 Tax=Caldalkalibacillus salinus TaxID=2803787 RepID=UPI0019234784|nr:tRNA 2-selenouridine(34) synthase MnmH [Caldalkalibacillus salinus]